MPTKITEKERHLCVKSGSQIILCNMSHCMTTAESVIYQHLHNKHLGSAQQWWKKVDLVEVCQYFPFDLLQMADFLYNVVWACAEELRIYPRNILTSRSLTGKILWLSNIKQLGSTPQMHSSKGSMKNVQKKCKGSSSYLSRSTETRKLE